ncbi:MAG: ABC transporter permease [Alphaproteobacteria bacterium]
MNRRTSLFLIAPSAAVFATLFIAPFVYFLVMSFWRKNRFVIERDFNVDNYVTAVTDENLQIGLNTLAIAVSVGLLTTILGFVYAYIVRFKAGDWGKALLFVALVTLFGGYLMKIYAWKTILGNEGVLNSAFQTLGLTDQPIAALLYSPGAVIVTLTHFLLPFAILPIYGSMRSITDSEMEAARDLGARPWQVLAGIIVPRCRTGITTAFLFAFLIAAGDYITPQLVGGKLTMTGNMIALQFGQRFNWPLGAAMSFVVLTSALFVIATTHALMSLWRPR